MKQEFKKSGAASSSEILAAGSPKKPTDFDRFAWAFKPESCGADLEVLNRTTNAKFTEERVLKKSSVPEIDGEISAKNVLDTLNELEKRNSFKENFEPKLEDKKYIEPEDPLKELMADKYAEELLKEVGTSSAKTERAFAPELREALGETISKPEIKPQVEEIKEKAEFQVSVKNKPEEHLFSKIGGENLPKRGSKEEEEFFNKKSTELEEALLEEELSALNSQTSKRKEKTREDSMFELLGGGETPKNAPEGRKSFETEFSEDKDEILTTVDEKDDIDISQYIISSNLVDDENLLENISEAKTETSTEQSGTYNLSNFPSIFGDEEEAPLESVKDTVPEENSEPLVEEIGSSLSNFPSIFGDEEEAPLESIKDTAPEENSEPSVEEDNSALSNFPSIFGDEEEAPLESINDKTPEQKSETSVEEIGSGLSNFPSIFGNEEEAPLESVKDTAPEENSEPSVEEIGSGLSNFPSIFEDEEEAPLEGVNDTTPEENSEPLIEEIGSGLSNFPSIFGDEEEAPLEGVNDTTPEENSEPSVEEIGSGLSNFPSIFGNEEEAPLESIKDAAPEENSEPLVEEIGSGLSNFPSIFGNEEEAPLESVKDTAHEENSEPLVEEIGSSLSNFPSIFEDEEEAPLESVKDTAHEEKSEALIEEDNSALSNFLGIFEDEEENPLERMDVLEDIVAEKPTEAVLDKELETGAESLKKLNDLPEMIYFEDDSEEEDNFSIGKGQEEKPLEINSSEVLKDNFLKSESFDTSKPVNKERTTLGHLSFEKPVFNKKISEEEQESEFFKGEMFEGILGRSHSSKQDKDKRQQDSNKKDNDKKQDDDKVDKGENKENKENKNKENKENSHPKKSKDDSRLNFAVNFSSEAFSKEREIGLDEKEALGVAKRVEIYVETPQPSQPNQDSDEVAFGKLFKLYYKIFGKAHRKISESNVLAVIFIILSYACSVLMLKINTDNVANSLIGNPIYKFMKLSPDSAKFSVVSGLVLALVFCSLTNFFAIKMIDIISKKSWFEFGYGSEKKSLRNRLVIFATFMVILMSVIAAFLPKYVGVPLLMVWYFITFLLTFSPYMKGNEPKFFLKGLVGSGLIYAVIAILIQGIFVVSTNPLLVFRVVNML